MHNYSFANLVGIISSCLGIAGVFGAILSRAIKSWLHEAMVELRPNGGGSTYDLVRQAATDASRAALAAEQVAGQAQEVAEQMDTIIERVSNIEQTMIASTVSKKIVPKLSTKKSFE